MKVRIEPARIVGPSTMNKTEPGERILALLLKVALCLDLSAAILAFGSGAQAAGAVVYSIVTNPGEDSSTQMNIGWHADIGCTNCFVTYTKKSDAAWAHAADVEGTYEYWDGFDGIYSKTASGADVAEDAVFLDCGVTLTGLERDKEYMYKVSAGSSVSSLTFATGTCFQQFLGV
jgi:hypothetical protein